MAYTENPEVLVYKAASTCYRQSAFKNDEVFDNNKIINLLSDIKKSGHMSPFEHANFTFYATGLSRACTHQLVRHRAGCAYSQQSARYCKMGEYITPFTIEKDSNALELYKGAVDNCFEVYQKLILLGVPKEDARMVIPQSMTSHIVFSMNAREIFHFLNVRMCNRAQWEIRELAYSMYKILHEKFPIMFDKCGPSCYMEGSCKESRTCGNPVTNIIF